MSRRITLPTVVALASVSSLLALAMPAAATTGLWADWSNTGSGSYSVQVANSPAMTATVTTDSRQGRSV